MSTNDLLKPGEVIAALRISRSTLVRWVADGKLEPIRLGDKTFRYRRSDVDALLNGEPVG